MSSHNIILYKLHPLSKKGCIEHITHSTIRLSMIELDLTQILRPYISPLHSCDDSDPFIPFGTLFIADASSPFAIDVYFQVLYLDELELDDQPMGERH